MTLIKPISIVIPLGNVNLEGCELYFQQRDKEAFLGGLWEFPGGKIEVGESPEEAAIREFDEEVKVKLQTGDLEIFSVYPFSYDKFNVSLFTYIYKIRDVKLLKDKMIKKYFSYKNGMKEFDLEIPEANIKIINDLLKYIGKEKQQGTWEMLWEQ